MLTHFNIYCSGTDILFKDNFTIHEQVMWFFKYSLHGHKQFSFQKFFTDSPSMKPLGRGEEGVIFLEFPVIYVIDNLELSSFRL